MGRQVWSDPALADPVRSRIPMRKFAGNDALILKHSLGTFMTNPIQ